MVQIYSPNQSINVGYMYNTIPHCSADLPSLLAWLTDDDGVPTALMSLEVTTVDEFPLDLSASDLPCRRWSAAAKSSSPKIALFSGHIPAARKPLTHLSAVAILQYASLKRAATFSSFIRWPVRCHPV